MPDLRTLLTQQILSSIPVMPQYKEEETITEYFSQKDQRARMTEMIENRDETEPMEFDDDDCQTIKDLTEDGVSQDTINMIAIR